MAKCELRLQALRIKVGLEFAELFGLIMKKLLKILKKKHSGMIMTMMFVSISVLVVTSTFFAFKFAAQIASVNNSIKFSLERQNLFLQAEELTIHYLLHDCSPSNFGETLDRGETVSLPSYIEKSLNDTYPLNIEVELICSNNPYDNVNNSAPNDDAENDDDVDGVRNFFIIKTTATRTGSYEEYSFERGLLVYCVNGGIIVKKLAVRKSTQNIK